MNMDERALLEALADAVERLLLANAANVQEVEREAGEVLTRRTLPLAAEEGTSLLNRIQALRGPWRAADERSVASVSSR